MPGVNDFLKHVIDSESAENRKYEPQHIIPSGQFPAEPNRYVLYIHPACPWSHRASIVWLIKGLEKVIDLIVLDDITPSAGWTFSETNRWGFTSDPRYGFQALRELYMMGDPTFITRQNPRVLIPVLWDTKTEKMVSNDSGDIIRMLYSAFDEFLAPEYREINQGSLYPPNLRSEINEFNSWTYELITDGVYRTGYASTQDTYDTLVHALFDGLDRVEQHLSQPNHQPYLFGDQLTDADIRLYPTILRFDISYHRDYNCNLKMIRHDYPHIHAWLKFLYWTKEPFQRTVYFEDIRDAYSKASGQMITAIGPRPYVMPL